MIRIVALLLVAAATAIAAGHAAAEPRLRPAVTVEGAVVRLGDLFADAGPGAAEPVSPSPAPGGRVTYGADWLAAAAREHKLAWQPASRYDAATVERASRAIAGDAVAARLLADLVSRQPMDDAEILLDNPGFHLVVPAEASDAIAIDGLTYDDRTGRLSAVVSAPAGDANAERQRIGARLVRMADLPVPNRAMAPGETITARDIRHIRVRRDRLAPDVAADVRELIGKTPRRPLQAEQPVRLADVQAPIVVRKGELVTIVLQTSVMRLTTQGKALEDGGMGAAIRITNTKSSRTIDAVVTGPNTVVVGGPAQLAAR